MTPSFTLMDVHSLGPFLIILLGALTLLLIEAFGSEGPKKGTIFFTLFILICSLISLIFAPSSENPLLTPWLRFDFYGKFWSAFFHVVTLGVVLLSYSFFRQFVASPGEYYFLLLSSLFGLTLIADAGDFLTLFLGLETLSISLYILCGYMKKWRISQESSIKYFLMGALATSLLLYGIAFIYGSIGSTSFSKMLEGYQGITEPLGRAVFLIGIALVTLGLCFKAGTVPFHTWIPDVYEGASNPVTAFMAIGTKAGAFAALSFLFIEVLPDFDALWNKSMTVLIYITLLYGNFVAIRQTQLRRFFGYSGIAHSGFLLIPIISGGSEAQYALMFYLAVYALGVLGSFTVLSFLDQTHEGVMVNDLRGLFKKSPMWALLLVISLLTLAGIPPTAGFLAKFYVFKIAFQQGYYGLVFVGLFTTILSAFYYFRIIAAIFGEPVSERGFPTSLWTSVTMGITSIAGIFILSMFPETFLEIEGQIRADKTQTYLIPNNRNKFIFELRESSRNSTIVSGSIFSQYGPIYDHSGVCNNFIR